MPLLHVLARLRTTARPPDLANVYDRTTGALRRFEQQARQTGVPPEQIRFAHYALCVSLDDVVLNTPWGADSNWAKRPLAIAFHLEPSDGGHFFELLTRLRLEAARFMPVIEIMYLCMSLGYMGRYRTAPRGQVYLDRIRAETCALLTAQTSLGPELSPRWRGIAAPHTREGGQVPLWVGYSSAFAACGLLFFLVSTSLNASSDNHYARMLSAPPAQMPKITRAALVEPPPPPPAPPEPTVIDRLQTGLMIDVDAGIVTITGTPSTPVIRVATRIGFTAGSATLQPELAAVFGRIGTLLGKESGSIQVNAYTDNQPIRSVQFPSNFALSSARANAASSAIAHTIGDSARISAEGRADADPIASNATAEGREQNQRIEIVLHRQG
jgi:type VI secretion system protein ImpK